MIPERIAFVNKACVDLLDEISQNSPYAITFNLDLDLTALLKMYSVQIDDTAISLAEKLIEYMKLSHQILGIRLFVFVNLRDYLSEDEMKQVYESAFYDKIQLLLIEGHSQVPLPGEDILIIDKDLCKIHLN